MVDSLTEELKVQPEEEVTLLVNGYGSTPLMELYLLNNAVTRVLAEKQIKVYRTFVGNYMTSIDMLGASVTLMKMNDQLKLLMDLESQAPAFRVQGHVDSIPYVNMRASSEENKEADYNVVTDRAAAAVAENQVTLENIVYIVEKNERVHN